jgi:FKBP-type peptidyl-prolyl cis-trans isomerase SlyD
MTSVQDNHVIEIHYTLQDSNGKIIDSSEQAGPLSYIQGMKNILPALESVITGKCIGDKFSVEIPSSNAYGTRDPEMVKSVPKAEFSNIEEVEIGMHFQVQAPSGKPMMVVVVGMEEDTVIMDGNHPFVDVDLKFDVEVASIRAATEEELAHGHVHTAGACGSHE